MLSKLSKNENGNKLPLQLAGNDSILFDSASNTSVEYLINLLNIRSGLNAQNFKIITDNLDGDARSAYQIYNNCKPNTIYIGHATNNGDNWLFKNCFYIMCRAIDYPYCIRLEFATAGDGYVEYGEDGKVYKYPLSIIVPYSIMRNEISNVKGACRYVGHTVICNLTMHCSGISSQENLIGFPELAQKVGPVTGGLMINQNNGSVIPLLLSTTSGYITLWNNIAIPEGDYIFNYNVTLND